MRTSEGFVPASLFCEGCKMLTCLLLSQRHSWSQEEDAGRRLALEQQASNLHCNTGLAAACGGHNDVVLALADAVNQLLLVAMQGAVGPVYCLHLHLSASNARCKDTVSVYIWSLLRYVRAT